jgi:hypothetical protein
MPLSCCVSDMNAASTSYPPSLLGWESALGRGPADAE